MYPLETIQGFEWEFLAEVEIDDIDWKCGNLRIIQGKTGDPLILPIDRSVLQAVADYGKTLHGMRRGLSTVMTSNGTPVETVAQVLGHKSMKATKQYISADMQGMRCCLLGFESLKKGGMQK